VVPAELVRRAGTNTWYWPVGVNRVLARLEKEGVAFRAELAFLLGVEDGVELGLNRLPRHRRVEDCHISAEVDASLGASRAGEKPNGDEREEQ
jgi:hypothetical protein